MAAAIGAFALVAFVAAAPRPALTVDAKAFQLDGHPQFVVGVSLFDALGRAAPRNQDLDALKSWGINLVRVWAHWHEPIYLPDGTLSEPGRTRLVQLAKRLRLARVRLRAGPAASRPTSRTAVADVHVGCGSRCKAVQVDHRALREYRNVVFDLYNKHDHRERSDSHRAARALRDKVKAIDPARLVTISSTEYHIVSAKGEVTDAECPEPPRGGRHRGGGCRGRSGSGAPAGTDRLGNGDGRTGSCAASGARQSRAMGPNLLERGAARGRWEAARRRQLRPCSDGSAQRGRRRMVFHTTAPGSS